MNISKVKFCDIANGTGVRTSIFVSGCRRHCKGCFNAEAWDFENGVPFDDTLQEQIINSLKDDWCAGITLLGGEPMEPENQRDLYMFLKRIREEFPTKTIWCYTGYRLKELLSQSIILPFIDVLVDGEFIEQEKDISLRFRGSRNQRMIDLKETMKLGRTILWDGY